jgi:adenylate kinase family enzyme
MDRIAIIGSSGSGKSTLARRVGERLGLPVVHMDQLYWTPGWVEQDPAVWRASVDAAAAGDRWVIEGVGSSASALRFARAQVIVWLETPRGLCLWRAMRRSLTTFGVVRPDMAPGCPEKIDLAFYRYIWRWDRDTRPRLEQAIAAQSAQARVLRLRRRAEIDAWLASLDSSPTGEISIDHLVITQT